MALYNIPKRPKDPNSDEVFSFNFTKYLKGSAIASIVGTTIPTGITQYSITFSSPYVYLGLRGGTAGETYNCSVKIATNDSVVRQPEFSVDVVVQEM